MNKYGVSETCLPPGTPLIEIVTTNEHYSRTQQGEREYFALGYVRETSHFQKREVAKEGAGCKDPGNVAAFFLYWSWEEKRRRIWWYRCTQHNTSALLAGWCPACMDTDMPRFAKVWRR